MVAGTSQSFKLLRDNDISRQELYKMMKTINWFNIEYGFYLDAVMRDFFFNITHVVSGIYLHSFLKKPHE